ncbi:hypothetical protein Tco_1016655 [Tanacetum coccineum]|uniref:DUF4283 domain-containing protein n=1 Tax=Tanacetum coccineum TaxID=301880 RepID=A0ABQ5FQG2_9ASTR
MAMAGDYGIKGYGASRGTVGGVGMSLSFSTVVVDDPDDSSAKLAISANGLSTVGVKETVVSFCLLQSRMSNTSDKGTTFGDGAARVGMQLRSSPKGLTSFSFGFSSLLLTARVTILDAGKHYELSSELTNEDLWKPVSYAIIRINLNVDESTIPSDPIVQSVDINKSTSYAGVTGRSAKDQPNVNSIFRTLVADPVFDGVNISIPRKVVEKKWLMDTRLLKEELTRIPIWVKLHDVPIQVFEEDVVSPPIVATSNVVTPNAEKTNDGFQTVGKTKKRKGKSKSTKEDDDEEKFEKCYEESANLIQNTKSGGSSSFTAAAG